MFILAYSKNPRSFARAQDDSAGTLETARPRAASLFRTRRGRRGSIMLFDGTDRQFDAELKNPSLLDYNRRAFVDHLEQFDHVLVTHPHAAVTRSRSDFVLVFRSMNVNETVARIRIVLVEPIQP